MSVCHCLPRLYIQLGRIWTITCMLFAYDRGAADLSAHRGHVNDDHVSFNTQTSTQVDGFRHYPYQNYPKEGEYT